MTATDNPVLVRHYPPGFRPRRGLNWGYLGLLYTSFYLCRYNLSVANKTIANEYHFSYSQMSSVIFTSTLVYAFGQIFNGLLTDRIGGKKAMLIGAAGTVVMNVLFGAASVWGVLGLFIAIRGIDGYFQSFGAPGMTKIKTAWFAKTERGGFSGIFGFMINLGRLGIFNFGPALLAGFTLFGMLRVDPLHWKWLFWGPSIICAIVAVAMSISVKETPEEHGYLPIEDYAGGKPDPAAFLRGVVIALLLLAAAAYVLWAPSIICAVVAVCMAFIVKQTPEAAGFHHMAPAAAPPAVRDDASSLEYARAPVEDPETRASFATVLRTILSNPGVWFTALAYACTGAVRQAVDQWFPRYMIDVHHADLKGVQFQWLAFLIPFVASVGSLTSGYVSDLFFKSRRAPVAAVLYLIETVIILAAGQFHSATAAVTFFVLISLTANSTHSLLGTAAAMDMGGRKMAGFASGLIDSFQYFGGSLAGIALGMLIDHVGWGSYFYFMAPFGLIGGLLMIFAGHTLTAKGADHH